MAGFREGKLSRPGVARRHEKNMRDREQTTKLKKTPDMIGRVARTGEP